MTKKESKPNTKSLIFISALTLLAITISAFTPIKKKDKETEVTIKIIQTSDVHGNFFPYDFINQSPGKGSLARLESYLTEQRKDYQENIILLDAGDILQGQPTAYYYNFIETKEPHICASILNYMDFSALTMGNHDIETGPKVYNKWSKECNFPILGANIIDIKTNKPAYTPYTIIEKQGVKIAILGLATPCIPSWLPEQLWEGLHFRDMQETAEEWIPIIKKIENPDLIVGLFHAGQKGNTLDGIKENPSMEIAKEVDGFDIILMGHDHTKECINITNTAGNNVLVMNPGPYANYVSSIDVKFKINKSKVTSKEIKGSLININDYEPDAKFMSTFENEYIEIKEFVSEKIGTIDQTISAKDAHYGPSKFIDFIHIAQLDLTGADISFTAPLSIGSTINKGDVTISDMFNLYKYENFLYTMSLTGEEIKGHLEYSYLHWGEDNYPIFNLDSAFGILYTVDLSKSYGHRINILSMANGDPFDLKKKYKVAINSYRGNGGGEHLTKGAGIPKAELHNRILTSTDKDTRYYLIQYFKDNKSIEIKDYNHWKFISK